MKDDTRIPNNTITHEDTRRTHDDTRRDHDHTRTRDDIKRNHVGDPLLALTQHMQTLQT